MPHALRLEPYAFNLLPITLPFCPQPATDPVKTFNPISQFPDPKSQIERPATHPVTPLIPQNFDIDITGLLD
jgi:hypothetical protein